MRAMIARWITERKTVVVGRLRHKQAKLAGGRPLDGRVGPHAPLTFNVALRVELPSSIVNSNSELLSQSLA